jgi:dienelactone hydrolase
MKKIVFVSVLLLLLTGWISSGLAEPNIKGTTVSYKSGDMTMEGYLAFDENQKGTRPGVLVVHEWWGLNDYARLRARMLAELGFTALALDMYGQGQMADHPEDAQKFSSALMKNPEAAIKRFTAGLDLLKGQPTVDPSRIAAIGYCFGGGVVLNMARQGVDLKGVASFHGSLTPIIPAKADTIKAKILVLTGAADKFVPPQQVEAFEMEMKKVGAAYQLISYPGAIHSFTNPEADNLGKKFKLPLGYNAEADQQSWEELKRFLKEIFQ